MGVIVEDVLRLTSTKSSSSESVKAQQHRKAPPIDWKLSLQKDVAAQALKDSNPLVNKRNTYQSSQSFRSDVRQSMVSRMFALVVSSFGCSLIMAYKNDSPYTLSIPFQKQKL